jgi:hypothetical protein
MFFSDHCQDTDSWVQSQVTLSVFMVIRIIRVICVRGLGLSPRKPRICNILKLHHQETTNMYYALTLLMHYGPCEDTEGLVSYRWFLLRVSIFMAWHNKESELMSRRVHVDCRWAKTVVCCIWRDGDSGPLANSLPVCRGLRGSHWTGLYIHFLTHFYLCATAGNSRIHKSFAFQVPAHEWVRSHGRDLYVPQRLSGISFIVAVWVVLGWWSIANFVLWCGIACL